MGRAAPAFSLVDETGAAVSLRDLRGQRVVLFFFQKARSPGCAVTATEFRDALPFLRKHGITVVGISPDTWRRHAKFRTAEGLPFPLLSDADAAACKAFGIWEEKLFYGKRYMGVARSAFLIDAEGRLEQAWRGVHYRGQAELVSAWLRGEPVTSTPPVVRTASGTRTARPARASAGKRAARKK